MLIWACWAWLLSVFVTGVAALWQGANRSDVAAFAAIALIPALTGFVLQPRLSARWAAIAWLAVWLIALISLISCAGGAASPLAAGLLIVPALALFLGRPWAPECGAAAVLGFALAAWLGRGADPSGLGAFAELLTVAAMAFATGLMALGARGGPGREQAIGQRIAEVSHELRTPLTHILGFSEMIERQLFGELSARYVEYAGLIRRSGAHLLGLVNDLLDLSKIDAGRYELEMETFDVRAVVEDVVRSALDAAEKKQIALGMTTPEAPLIVRADARAVKRMLINTVGNAIKFTPEGGKVIVSAAAEAGVLQLDTIDNGPGFPAGEREKLGEAFERGSGGARAEGTGLGLALVRALSRLHGGEMALLDAPGGGALVRITLPVLASA